MLVTKKNLKQVVDKILSDAPPRLGLDTETKGLWSWKSPHVEWYVPTIFSVQIHYPENSFYFDFCHSEDHLDDHSCLKEIFEMPALWFIQNAKFELHQMRNVGLEITGEVHCTKQMARLTNNLEPSLRLDDLAHVYLGSEKLDVKTYIDEHNLKTKVRKYSVNEVYEDWLHFDKLPIDLLVDYGIRDTVLCYQLGELQLKKIAEETKLLLAKNAKITLTDCYENEKKLTKVCFEMESVGIKIDFNYTKKAYDSEVSSYREIEKEIDLEAAPHVEGKLDWLSTKQLKPLFEKLGESYSVTEKGNASFDKDALEAMTAPIAKKILKYRFHYKRAHTYFENLLWLVDEKNTLRADFQPAGTQTGRMSCWNPNLQNIPKRTDKKSDDFKVRKCFVPREGFFFLDIDYDAAEYKMMIDYAREQTWANAIIAGEDVHEAAQKLFNLPTRDFAKTFNFGLLYGMGVASLAKSLSVTWNEAKELKKTFFARFHRVESFIHDVKEIATYRGFLFTFIGRKLQYDKSTNYKAPNGLIQGGVGDMCKVAMVRVHDFLKPFKSRIILQVHDAILFEIANDEKDLIPEIKKIMCEAYPFKILPMTVSAESSPVSWGDLIEDNS